MARAAPTPVPSRAKAPLTRKGVIAIDGPAGSGKSTVARGVAKALGFRRLDTGAMYRAVTLEALRSGIDPADGRALATVARTMRFGLGPGGLEINGRPPVRAIRSPAVSGIVSQVAAHSALRRELVRVQRDLIGSGTVVVEGRDIGTVVCPQADVKIFLTASSTERARRRLRELKASGVRITLAALKRDIDRRDTLDSKREVSPLTPAPDAHVIDSTRMKQSEVVAKVVALARERLQHLGSGRARTAGS